MSSSEDDSSQEGPSQDEPLGDFEEPDGDTLRIMISTDNHLGYLENDPIRGMDSFAAFEEVMSLAQARKVDCILLGGDLFHHNKPTRQTLHKTMEIMRRYTMGPDPVKIQILSDQNRDFRGAGRVNYEDENYSVDMPIFSIHGNHDDPTRDGGKELLAALDLLAMSNLVNYFGRQDQVDKVEVSPVLIQKGSTKCALYGLGNMRDERLNRMWQRKKVLFLRPENAAPEENDDDEDDEEVEWFNVFVLHQNRDNMGRGNKNCIHESMIPNWMDLAIFGHEHTSEPHPAESVVGTFRITQPGSSVATSLSEGESERKHAIVLDIRGCQFKMDPIPLTMVRPCIIHDLSLQDHAHLDPEDPKVDQKITQVLEEILHTQMINAREKQKTLLQDAIEAGNYVSHKKSKPLRFQMVHGEQPLIRLRVEHSGFTTLNNQRFGAKFVGKVANPTDILLFQRAKKQRGGGGGSGKGGSKKGNQAASDALEDPLQPEELHAVSVEDLIKENLEESEQKLDILKQKDLAVALEEFVDKSEGNAIPELTEHLIKKKQKDMLKEFRDSRLSKEKDESIDQEDSMMDDRDESFESAAASTQKRKRRDSLSDDDSIDKENQKSSRSKGRAAPKKKASKSATIDISSGDEEEEEEAPKPTKGRARGGKRAAPGRSGSGDIRQWTQSSRNTQASQATTASSKRGRATKKRQQQSDSDDGFDDSDVEVVSVKKSNSRSSPRRRTNKGKAKYADDDSDDDAEFVGDSSPEPEPVKKKRGRAAPKSSQRSGRGRKASQRDESFDLDDDWGTAATRR